MSRRQLDPDLVEASSGRKQLDDPPGRFSSSRPRLRRIVWIPKLWLDLGVGPTLRQVLRRPSEPATKVIKQILKPVLFVLQFPIQNLNEPLVRLQRSSSPIFSRSRSFMLSPICMEHS